MVADLMCHQSATHHVPDMGWFYLTFSIKRAQTRHQAHSVWYQSISVISGLILFSLWVVECV